MSVKAACQLSTILMSLDDLGTCHADASVFSSRVNSFNSINENIACIPFPAVYILFHSVRVIWKLPKSSKM